MRVRASWELVGARGLALHELPPAHQKLVSPGYHHPRMDLSRRCTYGEATGGALRPSRGEGEEGMEFVLRFYDNYFIKPDSCTTQI